MLYYYYRNTFHLHVYTGMETDHEVLEYFFTYISIPHRQQRYYNTMWVHSFIPIILSYAPTPATGPTRRIQLYYYVFYIIVLGGISLFA